MEPENQQDNFDLNFFLSWKLTFHLQCEVKGRRFVTGGAEDSHWRGAGRRTVAGGAEDSYWRGGGQ